MASSLFSLTRSIKTLTNPATYTISRFFSNPVQGKFRKQFKGRIGGICHRGDHISFGTYGLQALECSWVTARQIEAGRRAMTRNARGGKFWVRLIADKPVTQRPAETRMGRGKGAVAFNVASIQANRILYEISGVSENIARAAIAIAASKMPMKTRFVALK